MTSTKPQHQPRPAWTEWPEGFTGPHPHVVGCYLVIGYVGQKRYDRRSDKLGHVHRVKCLKCGKEFDRLQSSLLRSLRRNAQGCGACAKNRHKQKTRVVSEEEKAKNAEMIRERYAWVDLMKVWPPTPVEFVPEEKRFDGR